MNTKAKFSWGHIIAFVALILISYGTFMGAAYSANGRLWIAGVFVVVIDILLLFFSLTPQFLKGVSKKDAPRMRPIEDILFYVSPVVFVVALMLPFSPFAHFTNVLQHKKSVETNFNTAITSADKIFEDYKSYADARIEAHNATFSDTTHFDKLAVKSYQDALQLLLVPNSYEQLRKDAQEWMETSCKDATIWNVFTVGNINEIESAVNGWHDFLAHCSQKSLSTESNPKSFDTDNTAMQNSTASISEIKNVFKDRSFSIIAIFACILFYAMMMLPYFLQERDSGISRKGSKAETIISDDIII